MRLSTSRLWDSFQCRGPSYRHRQLLPSWIPSSTSRHPSQFCPHMRFVVAFDCDVKPGSVIRIESLATWTRFSGRNSGTETVKDILSYLRLSRTEWPTQWNWRKLPMSHRLTSPFTSLCSCCCFLEHFQRSYNAQNTGLHLHLHCRSTIETACAMAISGTSNTEAEVQQRSFSSLLARDRLKLLASPTLKRLGGTPLCTAPELTGLLIRRTWSFHFDSYLCRYIYHVRTIFRLQ